MTPKQLEKEITNINKRRHEIIREIEILNERLEYLTSIKAQPKLRKLEKIEIQSPLQATF